MPRSQEEMQKEIGEREMRELQQKVHLLEELMRFEMEAGANKIPRNTPAQDRSKLMHLKEETPVKERIAQYIRAKGVFDLETPTFTLTEEISRIQALNQMRNELGFGRVVANKRIGTATYIMRDLTDAQCLDAFIAAYKMDNSLWGNVVRQAWHKEHTRSAPR